MVSPLLRQCKCKVHLRARLRRVCKYNKQQGAEMCLLMPRFPTVLKAFKTIYRKVRRRCLCLIDFSQMLSHLFLNLFNSIQILWSCFLLSLPLFCLQTLPEAAAPVTLYMKQFKFDQLDIKTMISKEELVSC